MGLFKLYLSHILRKNIMENDSSESHPAVYRSIFRTLIGEVLMEPESLEDPGPYVPSFCQMIPDTVVGMLKKVTTCLIK